MAALGVPTTRALAAVTTGEAVLRETALPGAVLTRVAASHIRVGTFQYFAARERHGGGAPARGPRDRPALSRRPQARRHPYRALLRGGGGAPGGPRRALAAHRLHPRRDEHRQHLHRRRDHRLRPLRLHGRLRPGHGVQLDRPCSAATPTATSRASRSGTSRGWPRRCCRCWARTRRHGAGVRAQRRSAAFAPALRGGLPRRPAAQARARHGARGRRRAGPGPAGAAWRRTSADFTLTFRRLCDAAAEPEGDAAVRALFADAGAYDAWAARWRQRLAEEPGEPAARRAAMRAVNPAFIPRNHLVEAALAGRRGAPGLRPVRGAARGRGAALRGSAGARALRGAARAGGARPPDLLRHLRPPRGGSRPVCCGPRPACVSTPRPRRA